VRLNDSQSPTARAQSRPFYRELSLKLFGNLYKEWLSFNRKY